MNTLRKAAQQALEALENNKRTHYYCEDTWYSCPKHKDGCANEAEGDDCNCGADKANAEIEKAITALSTALLDSVEESEPNDHIEYNGWVLRQVLFDRGEPVGHREPVEGPVNLETVYETIVRWDECGGKRSRRELARRIVALYAQAPQRKPLTVEQIKECERKSMVNGALPFEQREFFARAIEQAHGIGSKI